MSKQLMIYERAVPVRAELHKDWSVKTGDSYAFAREINSVPLLAPEFAAAALEYGIVFAGEGETAFPAAVLGLEDGNNVFLDDAGKWAGRYVPAFLRRYPFVFAASEDGERLTLCIDAEFSGVNTEGRGERLFDADGNRTRFLEEALAFATEYQQQFLRTQAFCKRLIEHDLLEPAQARFARPDGSQRQLTGFRTISRDKLRSLPDAVLLEMARNDELELCHLHLHALGKLSGMAERLTGGDAPKARGTDAMPADS